MHQSALGSLIDGFLAPLPPGTTLRQVLKASGDESALAQDIARPIEANPLYLHSLLSIDSLSSRINQWTEELAEADERDHLLLNRLVGLLGKAAIRNLVACVRLHRMSGAGLPRKPSEKPRVAPREQLRFALAAEELCTDNHWIHPELAFVAGYHYDCLAALFAAKKLPKDRSAYLTETFKHAVRNAKIAYAIASHASALEHGKHVVAAALLAPIGKALMAVMYPKEDGESSWHAFVAQASKLREPWNLAHLALEGRRFEITHEQLSYVVVLAFGAFGEIAPALLHIRTPAHFDSSDGGFNTLARLLSLTNKLSQHSGNAPLHQGVLSNIEHQWLGSIGIGTRQLEELLNRCSEASA